MYIKPNLCICLYVCSLVPYALPQFWANVHEIWHVSSLYTLDGHERFTEYRSSPQAYVPHAVHTPLQMTVKLHWQIWN